MAGPRTPPPFWRGDWGLSESRSHNKCFLFCIVYIMSIRLDHRNGQLTTRPLFIFCSIQHSVLKRRGGFSSPFHLRSRIHSIIIYLLTTNMLLIHMWKSNNNYGQGYSVALSYKYRLLHQTRLVNTNCLLFSKSWTSHCNSKWQQNNPTAVFHLLFLDGLYLHKLTLCEKLCAFTILNWAQISRPCCSIYS